MQNTTTTKHMEKNNMTAVEWLAKELENYGNPQVCEINWEILDAFINKAKQMEEEQKYETSAFWFGRGILAGKENRIEELKPTKE